MLISTRGRYALRVLAALAAHPDHAPVPLRTLSEQQGISLKYLEGIMTALAKAGLVRAQHGKGGGYCLTRPPAACTVAEILAVTEGTLAPVACLVEDGADCPRRGSCRTLPMWQEVDKLLRDYFRQKTLADLL